MLGLDGLGNLDSSSGVIETPGVTTSNFDLDNRLLCTDPRIFRNADNFCSYLKEWFNFTGIFELAPISKDLIFETNFSQLFNVKFIASQSNMYYTIVAAFDMESSKRFINAVKSLGSHCYHFVLFAYTSFSKNDINIASRLNTELIGYQNIHDINNSIVSPFCALNINNTFCSKLQKELNNLYKPNGDMVSQISNGVADFGSSISSSLKEAAEQIKDSTKDLFGASKMLHNKDGEPIQDTIGSSFSGFLGSKNKDK